MLKQVKSDTYYRRLKKTCDEIKKNGRFNSSGFWKVKKRMERKKTEAMHAVMNKEGKLVTNQEEILEAYADYYKELLMIIRPVPF